jgi:cytochrome c oxidase cbb3-type subunit 2
MPAYTWLSSASVEGADVQARMRALRRVGVPYDDAAIAQAPEQLKGKTEMDALVAYLQGLGVQLRSVR